MGDRELDESCLLACLSQHRDAAWRPTQQEVLAVVTRDHDYTQQTAMFPEEPSQDDQSIPEYERTHLRSRFGSRRFASSDREIHFHTGYACVCARV